MNLWAKFNAHYYCLNKRNGNKSTKHIELYLSSQYITSWNDAEAQG
jgi:hypothetical protein